MRIPKGLIGYVRKHVPGFKAYLTGDFTGLTVAERRTKAAEARKEFSWAAAGVATLPIPFADFWLITPIQILMVQAIGNIYGHKLDRRRALAILPVLGGGWLGRQIAMALFKLGLPVLGGLVDSAIAFSWTQGMAKAAEKYFASAARHSAGIETTPPTRIDN